VSDLGIAHHLGAKQIEGPFGLSANRTLDHIEIIASRADLQQEPLVLGMLARLVGFAGGYDKDNKEEKD
jgi:hypothetical protein